MILIRVDANEQIGAGHVMRCLSIADAFRDAGQDVLFVTADHKADQLIYGKGFETVCLNSDWEQIGFEDQKFFLVKYHPEVFIVDSYYVTEAYFDDIPDSVCSAYIDDLNKRTFTVDYLINYNVFSSEMDYSGYEQQGTGLLLGPGYAPLRKEFRSMSPHQIRNDVQDVLVSAGGSDPQGITEKLIEEICPIWPDIRFHFVIGALNPRQNKIRMLAGTNVVLHINESDMAGLMKRCDIAISAAGSTLYELCAVGVPTITYTLADNQLPAAERFQKRGMMLNAGDCLNNKRISETIRDCLGFLISDPSRRRNMSTQMMKLVDGAGAIRIVETILTGPQH